MTTANILINGSLRLLRVIASGEPVKADQSSDGLEVLNQLLHGLKAEGADVKFANIELSADIPLPPEHILSLKYVLAAHLAPEYSAELTPEVAVEAARGRDTLQAAYVSIPLLRCDEALLDRRSGSYDIDQG